MWIAVTAAVNQLHGQKLRWHQEFLLEQILLRRQSDLVLLLLHGLCSAQSAGTSGGNETDLATSWCVPPDCWGLANMLMVTTTEGMLNRLCGDERWKNISGRSWYIHHDSIQLQCQPSFVSTLFKILNLLHTLHKSFSHRTFSTNRSKWWGLNLFQHSNKLELYHMPILQ